MPNINNAKRRHRVTMIRAFWLRGNFSNPFIMDQFTAIFNKKISLKIICFDYIAAVFKTLSQPEFAVPTTIVELVMNHWTWTPYSSLFFVNLKPVEISKNHKNIICTSIKVV